jgi:hypothetical protein
MRYKVVVKVGKSTMVYTNILGVVETDTGIILSDIRGRKYIHNEKGMTFTQTKQLFQGT